MKVDVKNILTVKSNSLFVYSVILYCLSMFLPVFWGEWVFFGFHAYVIGMSSVFEYDLLFSLPWMANVLYIVSLLIRKKNISLRILISIFTIAFSLFSFLFTRIPLIHTDLGDFEFYLGPGFLFWITSFILLLVSQIKEYKKTPQHLIQ